MSRIAFVLLSLFVPAAMAGGVEIVMDAAELDVTGDPLPYPAVLVCFDNSANLTEATGCTFDISYTCDSQVGGFATLVGDASPWSAVYPTVTAWQVVGDFRYLPGISIAPRPGDPNTNPQVWLPAFATRLMPTHPDYKPIDPDYLPDNPHRQTLWDWEYNRIVPVLGLIPAGLTWAWPSELRGTNVHFFHSPAEATATANGETIVLTDPDPMPQLAVPEPLTAVLLVAGATLLPRKKRE